MFAKTASNLINKQDLSFSGKFFSISDISRFLCFVVTKPDPAPTPTSVYPTWSTGESAGQSGALSLVGRVEIVLSLVETFIFMMLRQLSSAIKNHLVASKAPY